MKGQSKELVETILVITSIVIIISLSYFLLTSRLGSKKDFVVEEAMFYQVSGTSNNLFYTKYPVIDKTLIQILSDRMIRNSDEIFYGEGYGVLNSKDIIDDYMRKYYGDNWNLTIINILRNSNSIWLPNSEESTVSKMSSKDAYETGRYRTAPEGVYGNPSRIAIDSRGNAWVGNRGVPTVVKIGLFENNQCIDKNKNGKIETSYDKNKNGKIDKDEILPFDKDECILLNVRLSNENNKIFVRAVCIDDKDNIYAGLFDEKRLFYINGETGEIIKEYELDYTPYGCFFKDGKVWFSTLSPKIMVLDTRIQKMSSFNLDDCTSYGISPCSKDKCVLVSCHNGKIVKISSDENSLGREIFSKKFGNGNKGIFSDDDENIYFVSYSDNKVFKLDKNGEYLSWSDTCQGPHGIGMDSDSKIWVACSDSFVLRYDKDLNYEIGISFGGNHYVYNFFTDYKLKLNQIKNVVSYGKNFKDVDPSRVKTFHFPVPLPGTSIYAEGVLYVW
jgi:hypothetical protein